MLKIILVLLAGAVGTGCRYGLSSLIYYHIERPTFPYANLIIIDEMVEEGLVTLEDIRVIQYRGPRAP